MKKVGKQFNNAEVNIDLKKKEIKFNYPFKKHNQNKSFFFNSLYVTTGAVIGFIYGSILPYKWIDNYGYDASYMNWIYQIASIFFLVLCVIGGIILLGYISIFIHTHSKTARDSFARTNAIISTRQKYKINLKHKISNIHKIEGKKLIIFNYDIVFFEYCYIGYNKIRKIITKSVDYDNKKKEHNNFIAIFTFDKPIKEGYLYYKT